MPCLSTYTRYAFKTAALRKRKFSSLFLRLMWGKGFLRVCLTSATLQTEVLPPYPKKCRECGYRIRLIGCGFAKTKIFLVILAFIFLGDGKKGFLRVYLTSATLQTEVLPPYPKKCRECGRRIRLQDCVFAKTKIFLVILPENGGRK